MLKYFRFLVESVVGICVTKKEETVKEINNYAKENNMKIVQILACGDEGLFVVFEKVN